MQPLYAIYAINNNKLLELTRIQDGFRTKAEAIEYAKAYAITFTIIEYWG